MSENKISLPIVEPSSAESAVDPVCGMTINPSTAKYYHEHEGTRYYFCSRSCFEKFAAKPAAFLDGQQSHACCHQGTDKSHHAATNPDAIYTCPMHPEIRQQGPRSCPKCGMALEPETPQSLAERTEYTCPMHPEIVRAEPGTCPICGMALEPRIVVAEETNPELVDMTRRFWKSTALTLPLFLLAMTRMFFADQLHAWLPGRTLSLIEFLLATPVVLWGGWPFFVRMWHSVLNLSPNMFTLIGIGTGTAYLHSTIATFFPQIFPDSFRSHGEVDLYFEAAT